MVRLLANGRSAVARRQRLGRHRGTGCERNSGRRCTCSDLEPVGDVDSGDGRERSCRWWDFGRRSSGRSSVAATADRDSCGRHWNRHVPESGCSGCCGRWCASGGGLARNRECARGPPFARQHSEHPRGRKLRGAGSACGDPCAAARAPRSRQRRGQRVGLSRAGERVRPVGRPPPCVHAAAQRQAARRDGRATSGGDDVLQQRRAGLCSLSQGSGLTALPVKAKAPSSSCGTVSPRRPAPASRPALCPPTRGAGRGAGASRSRRSGSRGR